MGRLKSFFFGPSHGRHKYSKNPSPEPPASPSAATANSEPASSSSQPQPQPQSQSPSPPKRNSRLRRSLSMKKLRSSFRRKDHSHVPAASKPHQWQQDEKLVRAGSCNFSVKYLGSIEVTESRGMHICEDAAKQLRASVKKKVRAILWVSSDGLRVVDEDSKGLIVDQTIEKVSFCAPDRHNDKGFSYICRDGTTRRWLCHCFHSLREPGERLSHAVGCAFAACLERKQQRDKLCGVKVEFDVNKTSFTRQGSFRQTTMTEQMEAASVEEAEKENEIQDLPAPCPNMPFARPRQHASDAMLLRQGSFRGFPNLNIQSPFKRQLSLRLNELPSTLQRQQNVLQTHPELPSEEECVESQQGRLEASPSGAAPSASFTHQQPHLNQQQQQLQQPVPQQQQQQQTLSISAACQELSDGLLELSSQEAFPKSSSQQPQNILSPAGVSIQPQLQQVPAREQPAPQQTAVPQTVLAQPQTNPWALPSQSQAGINPWDPPESQASRSVSQAEKWLNQTSQTVSPNLYGAAQQGVVSGPSGEATGLAISALPVQNGFNNATHQQTQVQNMTYQALAPPSSSANINNSATAPVFIPNRQPPSSGVGISGTWTSDLSRTLPDSGVHQANTTNGYSSSFEAKWEALPSNQTPVMANNPFANATKAFEINL